MGPIIFQSKIFRVSRAGVPQRTDFCILLHSGCKRRPFCLTVGQDVCNFKFSECDSVRCQTSVIIHVISINLFDSLL